MYTTISSSVIHQIILFVIATFAEDELLLKGLK